MCVYLLLCKSVPVLFSIILGQAHAIALSEGQIGSSVEDDERRKLHAAAAEKRLKGDSHLHVKKKKYVRMARVCVSFLRCFVAHYMRFLWAGDD